MIRDGTFEPYPVGAIIHLMVPLACDLVDEGRILGQDTLHRDTKAAKLGRALLKEGKWVKFVLSAGFAPNRDKYPHQSLSLAVMMARDLWTHGEGRFDIDVLNETWGTRGELLTAKELATQDRFHLYQFHVVTSWYHWIRTWCLVRKYLGKNVSVHVCGGSWKYAFQELWKTPAEILFLFFPKLEPKHLTVRGRGY